MHFRVFDCWRLTAAILVMTYHFAYAAPYGAVAVTGALHRLLPLLDMFFMISGFFITARYATRIRTLGDYGEFMKRRVARLYPLHLVTTLFFAAVALGGLAMGANHYPYASELSALPYHLLALHALGTVDHLALNFVSWSVSAEIFSYAMFPAIVLLLARFGFKGLAAGIAAWIGGLEIASRLGAFPSGHWTDADTLGAFRAFADFSIGAAIAYGVKVRVLPVRSHGPGLVVLGMALAVMLGTGPRILAIALLALSLLLTALAETANPEASRRLQPLMGLTRVSFGIYLWHPVMEFLFMTVLWSRWLEATGAIDFYVYWLLPMVATIAVALVSDRTVERWGNDLVCRRKPREKAAAAA
ncbi:acyltransferase [Aurantimonas sp. Leaf443]|uniref:acyltransferase family protein n=1 Tax=Aurantimonas sp. Leaf443 TaxID=1736378 RepID=UPI0006F3F471|nr:acyltransferase [Aurantimonas sp. Leaf443]KQT85301.1 hypothetical protein ASG48_08590 [Aurantimonas sp. Leaf443]